MSIRILNTEASVVANSNVITLNRASNQLRVGDQIIHSSLSSNLFIREIKSEYRIIASNLFLSNVNSEIFGFARDNEISKLNKFLNAYNRFLESSGNPQEVFQNINSYKDVDLTIDLLLENFYKNFAYNISRNLLTEKRTFIKRVKDIYKRVGSEEALKIMFRALYGQEIQVIYPEDKVLKASDGVWVKDFSLKVRGTSNYSPFFFENTIIQGAKSKATAVVSKVIGQNLSGVNFHELILDESSISGNFLIDEVITGRKIINIANTIVNSNILNVSAVILPSITNVDIVATGSGYTPNNIITINSPSGGGAISKVKIVNKTGKLVYIEIQESGVNYYSSNTTITIDSPRKILRGNILVIPYTTTTNLATFTGDSEYGLIVNDTCNVQIATGNIQAKVKTILNTIQFRFETNTPVGFYNANLIYDNTAILRANIGAVKITDGYWKNSKGKLSEKIFLRGSSSDEYQYPIYYQPFSYVIRTTVSKDQWENLIRSTTHPAGTELFSEVNIDTSINDIVTSDSIDSEIWNYIGITSDKDSIKSDATLISGTNLVAFSITSDHVYLIFNYL